MSNNRSKPAIRRVVEADGCHSFRVGPSVNKKVGRWQEFFLPRSPKMASSRPILRLSMKFPQHRALVLLLSACVALAGVSQADATQGYVATGLNHSLAIKPDGTLWTWGYNNFGQLGIGITVDQWFPAQVSDLSGVVAAGGGMYHSVAAKADGTVWAWGYNYYGQLGDGTTTQRLVPVQVLTGAVAIAAGDNHSLALLSTGLVMGWGYNANGQVGDGTQLQRNVPTQVSTIS